MPHVAGIDRSGSPVWTDDRLDSLYVVCVAAIDDPDAFGQSLLEIKQRFGLDLRAEFHGRAMTDGMQIALLDAAESRGLRVGALLIDKARTLHENERPLPSTVDFQIQTGVVLLEKFFAVHPLAALWCDEDIRGKADQQRFVTAVKRIHRETWPGTHIKVRHRSSESSDLIQLADVVAYGLSRLARSERISSELKTRLETIWNAPHNLIVGPQSWQVEAEE